MSTRTLFIPLGGGGPSPSEYYTKEQVDALIADFITNTVDDLVFYYSKSETYTKAEVQQLVGQITSFEVVATLPTEDIKTNVIYLLGPIGTGADRYEEWIYSNSTWVKIGETSIDLSNYITVTQLNTALGFYTPTQQLATVATSGLYSDLSGTPTLSTVATSGAYSDLTGTPTLATVATTGAYSDLTGTPTLATVATSGSYNDLTDKPTIPVVPTLATVATTGDYNDLTNKPSIPTVGTGVITLTQGSTTIGTFGLNDANNKTIDIPAGSEGKPYIELDTLSQQELEDLYADIIQDTIAYLEANAIYYYGRPVNYCIDGLYTVDKGYLIEDETLNEGTVLFQLHTTANFDCDNITYTNYVLLFSNGSLVEASSMVEGGTAVEGTNDGTNWTSLTIGTETYDIPQGGGSGNAWYGSQARFDTLGTYDPDTDYYISDIYYSEIKGKPNLSVYETKADSQAADQALDAKIAGKMEQIVFVGTAGLPSIGTPLEGVTYAIEGETLPLTFTLADQSTVTYNFVID